MSCTEMKLVKTYTQRDWITTSFSVWCQASISQANVQQECHNYWITDYKMGSFRALSGSTHWYHPWNEAQHPTLQKNKPVAEAKTLVPGFLFPCRHKWGGITILPLVTRHNCLLRLKMGHTVVIFPPAVCKDSGFLSKETILELNLMPLHACYSCPMKSLLQALFRFSKM